MSGLPGAFVITVEFDVLRDEGEAYAARLRNAGVPATCRRYPGMIHSFTVLDGVFDTARESIADCQAALRAAFAFQHGRGSPAAGSVK